MIVIVGIVNQRLLMTGKKGKTGVTVILMVMVTVVMKDSRYSTLEIRE